MGRPVRRVMREASAPRTSSVPIARRINATALVSPTAIPYTSTEL